MNILNKLTPHGRLTRAQFWPTFILSILLYWIWNVIVHYCGMYGLSRCHAQAIEILIAMHMCYFVPYFCFIYPQICKRLHDIGKSSATFWMSRATFGSVLCFWYLGSANLIGYKIDIPFIYALLLFLGMPGLLLVWYYAYFFIDSQPGCNVYGDSEKYPHLPQKTKQGPSAPSPRFNIICGGIFALTFLTDYLFNMGYLCLFIYLLTGGIRVYKYRRNLFYYCCLLTMALMLVHTDFPWQFGAVGMFLESLFQMIGGILLCVAAYYCAGTGNTPGRCEKQALQRGILGLGLTMLLVFTIFHGSTLHFITELTLLYSLKWSYEYLRRRYSNACSISLATGGVLLVAVISIMISYLLFSSANDGMNSIFTPKKLLFLSNILFIACIIFFPKTSFISNEPGTNSAKYARRAQGVLIACYIALLLLYLIESYAYIQMLTTPIL